MSNSIVSISKIKDSLNILFINKSQVTPFSGGKERITYLLARAFEKELGYTCYNTYITPQFNAGGKSNPFKECVQLKSDYDYQETQLKEFIIEKEIDVIINQDVYEYCKIIKRIKKLTNKNIKIIYCHHVSPGAEYSHLNLKYYLSFFKRQNNPIKNICRCLLLPFDKIILPKKISKQYRTIYDFNDQIVLLSQRYINPWKQLANRIDRNNKINAINNCLTYDKSFPQENLINKKKIVLIVSRLSENHKNISEAFSIWEKIELDKRLSEWSLTIVGDGPDKMYYKNICRDLGLKRVCFLGQKDPLQEYQEASIYMMTSTLEGWPMTLGEAKQNGLVPIAYNSFLAAEEIIKNQIDGILIKPFDRFEYVTRLTDLMINTEKRILMAKNAIDNCKLYTEKNICLEWKSLLMNLTRK